MVRNTPLTLCCQSTRRKIRVTAELKNAECVKENLQMVQITDSKDNDHTPCERME